MTVTSKSTYWLTGPDDHRVLVEGAARRDELTEAGWTETTEPTPNDRVWLRHDVTGAYALFGAGALEAWHARGWQHAVPPTERGDLGHVVVLPEPGPELPEPGATPLDTETPAVVTPPAKTESKKENPSA